MSKKRNELLEEKLRENSLNRCFFVKFAKSVFS